jgi:hypothetical protein
MSLIAGLVALILKERMLWKSYLESLGVSVAGWRCGKKRSARDTPSRGPDLPLADIALPISG